jgi:hypothetical protein
MRLEDGSFILPSFVVIVISMYSITHLTDRTLNLMQFGCCVDSFQGLSLIVLERTTRHRRIRRPNILEKNTAVIVPFDEIFSQVVIPGILLRIKSKKTLQ